MNRGLLKGIGQDSWPYTNFPQGKWLPYGPEAGEQYPLLDATGTTPNLGSGGGYWQHARFMVQGGMVFAYGYVGWGAGGSKGSGDYLVLLPPVGPPSLFGTNSTVFGAPGAMTVGFAALSFDGVGLNNAQSIGVAINGTAGVQIPAWRGAYLCPHRWFERGSRDGTAFNGFGQDTVTHNLGLAPDVVMITPTGAPASSPWDYAVTTKGASTFTVTAQWTGWNARTGKVADGVTNGTTTITSATMNFTKADIGALVTSSVAGQLTAAQYITAVTDVQTATISAVANGSSSANIFTISSRSPSGTNTFPYDWLALAAYNGTASAGIFVTDSWPRAWGGQNMSIEWRLQYPIAGVP